MTRNSMMVSEYIVKYSDFGHDMPPEVMQDNLSGWVEARTFGTPVIRCRDCKWGQAVDEIGCIRLIDRMTRSAPPHDPDGFCAWAEPKEEA